jgi:NhaP-type Na+/H+ and K+/H+ antiporter
MPVDRRPTAARGSFDPLKVLAAMGFGAALGVFLAVLMHSIMRHTPADLPLSRLQALYGILVSSGALAAFAIESIRQLQASSPEADYHRRRGFR